MNRYIKTYGMMGLIEWHGSLRYGSVSMKVDFTGGGASAFGVAPAMFTTSDEVTQFVIEHSDKFKEGSIKLIRKAEIERRERTGAIEGIERIERIEDENHHAQKGGVQKVEVVDRNDAVEWLKEHYPYKGYSQTSLRTKTAFDAACEECGVEFEFKAE